MVCSNVRLWKLDTQKEWRNTIWLLWYEKLEILRVSWTAKKTNGWVLNEAGVKKELLDTGKARKLAYCGQTRNITTDFDKTWGPAPSTDAVSENGVNWSRGFHGSADHVYASLQWTCDILMTLSMYNTCVSSVWSESDQFVLEAWGCHLELWILGIASAAVEILKINTQLITSLVVRGRQPEQSIIACTPTTSYRRLIIVIVV